MALRDQPYIPLYVQDYLTDEKLNECSASTQGVYIKLMCVMHKSDEYGTILLEQKHKQDSNQIKNFALKLVNHLPFSVDIIFNALSELIQEKVIYMNGDKLSQKRMIKDNCISLIRSESGKKGGKKTQFAKAKIKATAKAKKQANTEYEYEYENEDDIENIKSNDAFEKFWSLYPKKIGKKAAEKSFKKISKSLHDKIYQAIETQKESEQWKKENGQYIPNPATWLNQGRWDDVIQKVKTAYSDTTRQNIEVGKEWLAEVWNENE